MGIDIYIIIKGHELVAKKNQTYKYFFANYQNNPNWNVFIKI
jgi:hypothetical protein